MARLDTKTRAAVELLVDSAAAEGLPTQPLRSIALLGITRKADSRQIIAAVRRELVLIRTARNTLGRVDETELTASRTCDSTRRRSPSRARPVNA